MASLTVIMSVYNNELTLNESVKSILSQNYTDFIFFIIDDCSTDYSKKILQKFATQDSRIRLILNKKNLGLGFNLKHAILESNTKWVARMDADDIAKPDRLLMQMTYVEQFPEIDIVGTWANDINDSGTILRLRKVPITDKKIKDLIWACPFLHPTVLMKREKIIAAGNYNPKLRRCQDYDLWFRCMKTGLNFANIPMGLLDYRFTDKTHNRTGWQVALLKLQLGWKGCWKVSAGIQGYLGVLFPFIKGILPKCFRPVFQYIQNIFDPRQKN